MSPGGSSGTGLNIDARGAYDFHQEIAGDCHSRSVFNGGYFGSGDAGSLALPKFNTWANRRPRPTNKLMASWF